MTRFDCNPSNDLRPLSRSLPLSQQLYWILLNTRYFPKLRGMSLLQEVSILNNTCCDRRHTTLRCAAEHCAWYRASSLADCEAPRILVAEQAAVLVNLPDCQKGCVPKHGGSSAYAFEGVEHIAADGLATWGTTPRIGSYTGTYATWLLPSPAIIIAAQTDAVDG